MNLDELIAYIKYVLDIRFNHRKTKTNVLSALEKGWVPGSEKYL